MLLAFSPGPDNLFVLAQSAMCGRRAGMLVVLGLCTGLVAFYNGNLPLGLSNSARVLASSLQPGACSHSSVWAQVAPQ